MKKIIMNIMCGVLTMGSALITSTGVYAANDNKNANAEAKVAEIKADPNVIYGEGWGATPSEADRDALKNLLSKIGTTVESTFSSDERETIDGAGNLDSQSDVHAVMKSYSQATLNNTQTAYYREGEAYCLVRYINRAELDKMFAARHDRVEDYVRTAMRSEQKGRADDALRFYNWAYVLLHSLQYPAGVTMKLDGTEEVLVNWIPRRMSRILDNIEVKIAGKGDDNSFDLMFTFNGEPAAGLDFTYWNGRFNSPPHSVKDGMGKISFPDDFNPDEISLSVETKYGDSAMTDKELQIMMRNFNCLSFPGAIKTLGVVGKTLAVDKGAKKELEKQVAQCRREGVTPLPKGEAKAYDEIVTNLIGTIRTKGAKPDASLFTPEGLETFNALLGYGNVKLIGNPTPGYYPLGDKVVCRSIPMQFSFKNNYRKFIEDVTFTFNEDRKIENVAFGLGGTARRDIFAQGGDVWGDSIKMVLVTFLENYKTAFALKRLDYIKSIFDDNAYIIVGHKLKKLERQPGDMNGFGISTQYSYQQKSKSEYIDQLARCFASNEYVNVNFADNDVQKAAFGGNTFGIQIKQDYHSEHYGDQGYLFLFVDLNEADKPVIKIRTWQPERQADITPYIPKSSRDYGIYGVYSFQ